MRWTVVQVAEALGVPPPSRLDRRAELSGVSIDSRTIQPTELFIAIRGPSHDGHKFVADVLAGNAAAAIVDRDEYPGFPDEIRGRLYAVDDTLAGLQRLASRACEIWRGKVDGPTKRKIAGVAGSVGKTTTKEILAALLGARLRVLKTKGNLNNEYGLPLTLLQLDPQFDAAVVELGMSHRGELAALTRVATPEVGVITRVAVEHLEFFSSIDEIALAERELVENLPWPNAAAILNADDDRVARFAEVAQGRVILFGTSPQAEFRAENIIENGVEGSSFDFVSPAGHTRLVLPLIGHHNVMNALAALAAASVWGVGADEAARVFPTLSPADKRGEVVRFEEGFSIINDSYNSSPTALRAMVEVLAATRGYQRRIVAAGEMLELGKSAPELHRECGRHAGALKKIDWIFAVRGVAADFIEGAIEAGHPRERARFFEDSESAGEFLESFISPGDLLLVKGSRGVKMEKILAAVERQHARAAMVVASSSEVSPRGRG
jgi:UDP-N-acetylmuramoyl-tripeptide--D-alanyl-D-alanine ligase